MLTGLRFATELQKLGHEVQVITGFPHYPGGKFYPGYRARLWQRELMDGVEVLRVPVYPSHDRSAIRRMLCYGSLALSMMTLGPFLLRKADLAIVYVGSMTLCLPALLFKWLRGIPFLLDVQDLWPESVTGSGMLRGKWAHRVLSGYCSWMYRRAKHIVVLSEGYQARLLARGVKPDQVTVVYNWCDPAQEQGFDSASVRDSFNLRGRFNVVYTGNLGELQALHSVIHAARLLREMAPTVRVVFVGQGTQEHNLKALAARIAPENVTFLPRLPLERLREVLDFAGVLLVHLKKDPLSEVGIPQKTQACLAAGIPTLCAVEGEAARLMEQSGGGVSCAAESPEALAKAIVALASLPEAALKEMGRKGRDFYMQHLCFAVGVRRLARLFESTAIPTIETASVILPTLLPRK